MDKIPLVSNVVISITIFLLAEGRSRRTIPVVPVNPPPYQNISSLAQNRINRNVFKLTPALPVTKTLCSAFAKVSGYRVTCSFNLLPVTAAVGDDYIKSLNSFLLRTPESAFNQI